MIDKRVVAIYENLYGKYIHDNTNCEYIKVDNIDNIKQILDSYYKDLIDDRYDETYQFKHELNKVGTVYQFAIKGLEFFDIYILNDNIDYCLNIIKLLNIFSRHILDGNQDKESVVKARLRGRSKFPIYIFPNNITRNLIDAKFTHDHLDMYKKTNQAFTTSGMTGSYMVITKSEELIKLLLHELIHFYKLDGTIGRTKNYLDKYRIMLPFTDYNDEEECIAELLSNIYNCMFICIISSLKDKLNKSDQLVLLEKIISDEQKYSYHVIAKILYYFNIDPSNMFSRQNIHNKVELVSPINLYHIFKSIIYNNIDILLECNNCDNIFDISNTVYKSVYDMSQKIYKKFVDDVSDSYKNIKSDGNLNVSYILHDIDISKINKKSDIIQKGGNIDYYRKYMKYKTKYINTKNLINK